MKNNNFKKASTDPLDDRANIHSPRYLDTGRYFKQKAAEHRYVQLDEDIHAEFPTAREVNETLRELLRFRKTITQLTSQKPQRKKTA